MGGAWLPPTRARWRDAVEQPGGLRGRLSVASVITTKGPVGGVTPETVAISPQ